MNDGFDVAIVGAGVVGCAIAHALAFRGRSVVVLEAGARVGEGMTSRNSGVIHSGLYYTPGSLKAEACIAGQRMLYAWVESHGVWHARVGKLVVAQTRSQVNALERLLDNARRSGATGIELVSARRVHSLEPSIAALAALYCPATGIVDPVDLTSSLKVAAQDHGAVFVTHAEVLGIETKGGQFWLSTRRGELAVGRVINCAGLFADEVARLAGIEHYRIHPCRGDYFRLRSATQYRHLVYPVRDGANPGLGVHLTLERGGGYRLGPDAEYVVDKRNFTPAEHKQAVFAAAACQLLGPIEPSQLSYDSCGIRPKLRGPSETTERDFVLREDLPGVISLVGIESPGLTAALDLAERVARLTG